MSRKKKQLIGPEALFRYRIVSTVKALELGGLRPSAAVRAVANADHFDEDDTRQTVSERTIYRWLAAHEHRGPSGLERAARPKVEGSKVLDRELLVFFASERRLDRDASIPELLRRAEQYDIVPDAAAIDRTSAWRAMQRMGVETRRRKQPATADTRRFRYAMRMQMCLLDFKHFRAGVTRAKRAAVYMLDDATRYALDVLVATSERADVVLRLLNAVIRSFGLMELLYWDGGSGFKDGDVLQVAAHGWRHSGILVVDQGHDPK